MEVYYYGDPKSDTVLIQPVDGHFLNTVPDGSGHNADPVNDGPSLIEKEVLHIQRLAGTEDFLMAAVIVGDWNRDLSPWPAPPVFGNEPFGDGAKETLAFITEDLMPQLAAQAGDRQRKYYIGGYSMAGMFALWSVYQSDRFSGAAAVSPSVWFPGFAEYTMGNELKTRAVYLSLGDREEKTRNSLMSQVGNAIRTIKGHLEDEGVPCVLEWNSGSHFKDPELRTAKGFAWLLGGRLIQSTEQFVL